MGLFGRKPKAPAKPSVEELYAEWRLEQQKAREETARLIELEREQMRQRKEQERLAKAELAQQAWNRKQEEINRKNEERIFALEQRMELAEREIAHYKPLLESLEEQYANLDNRIWYLSSKGLPCEGLKRERDKLSERMYKMETKVIKAQQTIDMCQYKM